MKKSLKFIFLVILFSVAVFSITLFCKEEHVILEKETKQAVSLEPTVLTGGVIPEEITENTVLKKGEYTVNTNLVIAEDVTLEVEAGSVITFAYKKVMTVYGTLKLLGTSEEKVNVNHSNSGEEVIFITIESTGNLESIHSNIVNQYNYSEKKMIVAIKNMGSLNMHDTSLQSTSDTASMSGKVVSSGNMELVNNQLISVYLEEGSGSPKIENNRVSSVIKIPLEICDMILLKDIKGNYKLKESSGTETELIKISLTGTGILKRSVRLYGQDYTMESDLVIPENVSFLADAGTTLTLSGSKIIAVEGTLKLFGTEEKKVNLNYFNYGDKDNLISIITIEPTGMMESTHVNMKNLSDNKWAGNPTVNVNNKGILKMHNTEIKSVIDSYELGGDMLNSGSIELIDSKLPWNLNLQDGTNNVKIENNYIRYQLRVPLEICDMFLLKDVKGNYTKKSEYSDEMVPLGVQLSGTPVRSVRLYKQEYIMNSNLIVPENTNFVVEAGTTLSLGSYDKVSVLGMLKLLGTSEETVKVTYVNAGQDEDRVTIITIEPTGELEALWSEIQNIYVWGWVTYSVIGIDNKGILKIHDTIMSAKDENSTRLAGRISSSGSIELIDSTLTGSLILNSGSMNVNIQNNLIHHGIYMNGKVQGALNIQNNQVVNSTSYPVSTSFDCVDQHTFANVKNNLNEKNELYNVIYIKGTPESNVKLTKNHYFLYDNFTIPKDTLFEVEAGSLVKFTTGIIVDGMLNLSGSVSSPITMTNYYDTSTSAYWDGITISETGTVIASNIDMRYAGDSLSHSIGVQGQLIMWNSKIANCKKPIIYNTSNLNQVLMNNYIGCGVRSNIPLQAAYNYWNHKNGPSRYNDTGAYVSAGSGVTNNVAFYPYYSEFVKNDLESIEFLDTYVYEMPHFGQTGVNFTGNYSKQYIDFEFLNINRVYNSKSEKKDIFGFGWSFGYSSRIEPHPFLKNTYLVYLPDSSIAIFEHKENGYVSLNNRSTLEKKNDKYIFTTKEKEVYTYNLEGKLETITDVYGNVTTLTYNKNGLLEKITDHVNRSYTLKYNEDQLVTKITDPIGRSIGYQYQGELLQKVTSFNGMVTEYAYNSKKQLTSIKEDGVFMFRIKYIESGTYQDRVYQIIEARGNELTYSYNGTDNLTIETDSNDRIKKTYYDRDGYEYKVINPIGATTTSTYLLEDGANKYGELASLTKINGAKIIYTRDANGNVTKIANPDSSTKQYVYNSKNKVVKEIDELGNIKEYIYDSDQVTLLKEVIPLDGKTLYSETEEQSKYQIITYTYYEPKEVHGIKNLMKTKTDQKGTTTYTYDQYGNVNSITNANNQKTVYTKNPLDWTLTEQNQYLIEYEYDDSGNVVKVMKDSNLISMTEYNNRNKPEKIMDGNCNIPSKQMDPFETKTFEISSCDYTYYVYNSVGDKAEETDKEGNKISYMYDQYGNVAGKVNPNGSIEYYEYDELNRLVKTYFRANDEADIIVLEEKIYEVASSSKITTKEFIDDYNFKTKIETYNNRDLLVSEQVENQTKTKSYLKNGLLSYEIDANGNYTYYYYNKRNLLEKKYEPASRSYYICTIYVYDNFGRVIEEKVGKGTVSNGNTPSSFVITYYEYDDLGQVIKKRTSSNEEISYIYDSLGRVTKEKTKINHDSYAVKEYEYNYLDKITKETEGEQVTTLSYDKVGNVIKKVTGDNVATTYEYNKNYKLTKTVLNSNIQEEMTYDSMGNMISKTDPNGNKTEYLYDQRNHLLKEKNPKGLYTSYSYDYLGRKLSETTPNGKTTTYVYDNYDNVIQKNIGEISYIY